MKCNNNIKNIGIANIQMFNKKTLITALNTRKAAYNPLKTDKADLL